MAFANFDRAAGEVFTENVAPEERSKKRCDEGGSHGDTGRTGRAFRRGNSKNKGPQSSYPHGAIMTKEGEWCQIS